MLVVGRVGRGWVGRGCVSGGCTIVDVLSVCGIYR